MAFVMRARVAELATTTGTGAFTLSGAATGYQAFSAVCSVGDTVEYVIVAVDGSGNPVGDWEEGIGTYSAASTLTRTTVASSSNAGSAVSFSAGSKVVMISQSWQRASGLRETKAALSSGAIDCSTATYFSFTVTANTTFSVSNVALSGFTTSFLLDLTNGGSATITWWTGMKWAGGTAPTLTSAGRDVLGFFTHDGGTTWSGLLLGKDVK